MIYFTNVINRSSKYMMVLLEDEEENWLDCWVFDIENSMSFKGHLSDEFFNFLMKDKLLASRDAIFAAAKLGPKDTGYEEPKNEVAGWHDLIEGLNSDA